MSTKTASMRGSTTRRRKPAAASKRRVLERAPNANVVDLARVVEARKRIASGWYDRSDVRDSLVEAVLEEIRGH
jgi:transposase